MFHGGINTTRQPEYFSFLFLKKFCANKTAKMTIKIQSQQDVPLYKQDLYNNELHNSKIFKDARLKIFDGFPNWFRYNNKPSIDIFFRSILDGSKTLERKITGAGCQVLLL